MRYTNKERLRATTQIDEETKKFNEIFVPGIFEQSMDVFKNNHRFAYYTSAETALKIIRNKELWLRNALVMNDFSEISYGLRLIQDTFSGPAGERFRKSVEETFEGTIQEVEKLLNGWMSDWELETYIACVSLHDENEDQNGRLSMWRAYGNTALIIRNTPMMAVTDLLAVYSVPVMYLSPDCYETRLNKVTEAISINREYLQSLGQPKLVASIHNMLFHTAIGSKHPGFSEEQEWRLYYRPNERNSTAMTARVEILGGIPQIIYALSLEHDPAKGLDHADIPSLLDRVLVGPTEHPYVTKRAFQQALDEEGVSDVEKKVLASDIPLRTG